MVTNLQDQANQFVQEQTAQYQSQPTADGAQASPFAPTSILPGNRNVGLQDTGASANNSGAYWARRGLDTVKSDVDRINADFNSRLASFEQEKARQAAMAEANGTGNIAYGDINAAGKAFDNFGNLSSSRQALLNDASSYIGSKYVLGGKTKQGIDCSGLVMAVYNKLGFNVSQHSAGWQGRSIPGVRTAVSNLRPGDIVAWKDGSHIAIYAGNGEIIEAANTRVGTVRRKIWASPDQLFGIAVRLPGESTGIGTSGGPVTRATQTSSGTKLV